MISFHPVAPRQYVSQWRSGEGQQARGEERTWPTASQLPDGTYMVIVDETIELTVTLRREGGARGAVEVQNKPEQLAKQQDCFVLQVSKVQLERYKRRTLTTVQMLMDTSTYTNMRVAKVACVCTLAGHRECPNCFERQATHLPRPQRCEWRHRRRQAARHGRHGGSHVHCSVSVKK